MSKKKKTYKDKYLRSLNYAKDVLNSADDTYLCKNTTKADIHNLFGRIFPEIGMDKDEEMRLSIIRVLMKDRPETNDMIDWLRKVKPKKWSENDSKTIGFLRSVLYENALNNDCVNENQEYTDKHYTKADDWLLELENKFGK